MGIFISVFIILLLLVVAAIAVAVLVKLFSPGSAFNWVKALKAANIVFFLISFIGGFIAGYAVFSNHMAPLKVYFAAFLCAVAMCVPAFLFIAFSMIVVDISQNMKIINYNSKKQTELLEKISANTSLDITDNGCGVDYTLRADPQNLGYNNF